MAFPCKPILAWCLFYETYANRISPDVTPQNAVSHMGLFCLLLFISSKYCWGLELYKVFINDNPGLNLTYCILHQGQILLPIYLNGENRYKII